MAKTTITKTIANFYGEEIHIKIEDGEIFIHHEDATEDFIGINEFLMQIILDSHECVLIIGAIRSMTMGNEEHFRHAVMKADKLLENF